MNAAAAFNIQIKYLSWSKNAFHDLTHVFYSFSLKTSIFYLKLVESADKAPLDQRSKENCEFERRQVKTLAGQGIKMEENMLSQRISW